MTARASSRGWQGHKHKAGRSLRPLLERMEGRLLLSYADGNGPVVTDLTEQPASNNAALVVSFDGPMNSPTAQNPANYRVNALAPGTPEFVTRDGPSVLIRSASYNASTHQVTLSLARPLAPGAFYRIWINGSSGTGLTDTGGTLFDGDNDDTAGGNFNALFARGKVLKFTDMSRDTVTIQVNGGGEVEAWRELNGDVEQLRIVGAVTSRTTLTGSVRPAIGSAGLVVIPSIQGLTGVIDQLPSSSFVTQASADPSQTPVVATPQNLPYSLRIDAVSLPSVPSIQSAVYAQSGGKWLIFGGRTNGMHGFNPDGLANFPPLFQNNDIIVIDPATGQTWTRAWSTTGLPASVTDSLSASNQEHEQLGDRLYAVGGYSYDSVTGQFRTYDTLTALSVSGLINAVINNGDVASQLRQIHDSRFRVTGGEMSAIGTRTYLVFGQDFEGGYNGSNADFVQIYSDEVRSFRIVDNGRTLGIAGYQAQRDPVNFRRRDYNLAPTILPSGQPGLTAFGGVFTPAGNGYRYPIVIGHDGTARVNSHYQQFFNQYTAANIPLYDARTRSMATIFFGGISLYNYDFSTGTLTSDTELPFVNDVTSFVQRGDGSTQEFIMPSQLPALLGTEAAFFASPGLPTYSNGVVKLNKLQGPTTLGYIYGGIYSTVPNTTDPQSQTTSSNLVFKVTLTPN